VKLKVKPGCVIHHQGQEYKGGDELELEDRYALMHGPNVESTENNSRGGTISAPVSSRKLSDTTSNVEEADVNPKFTLDIEDQAD
jgi:hypothetical protein